MKELEDWTVESLETDPAHTHTTTNQFIIMQVVLDLQRFEVTNATPKCSFCNF